jgi:hypothetical protein
MFIQFNGVRRFTGKKICNAFISHIVYYFLSILFTNPILAQGMQASLAAQRTYALA